VRRAAGTLIVVILAAGVAVRVVARGTNGAGASVVPAVELGSQASSRIDAAIDPVIDALWSRYDQEAARQHVEFISQYWRLPGNAGYNASLERVRGRLAGAGFGAPGSGAAGPTVAYEEYPNTGRGWDHTVGTLALVNAGKADEVILSRERERLALCINSFSTPPEGITAPLVDVGQGDRDEHYAGKAVKGAVVLGDADIGQLWRRAVATHGAIGVISTTLPRYLSADPPGAPATPRDQWDILQWGSIPYDEARKGFGFKASPRAAARLRAAGREGATVRVRIASTFASGPVRTLVAEIPGRAVPDERVVIAAHVQEPGANDNASGVATLAELALAMAAAVRDGRVPAPARTVTFLFLNEISGSRQWLQDHPEDAKRVKYMFSMDMTGEDVTKTGGSFLIERHPDPGAVWDRPWDPHSEWGRGNVRAEQLKGDLLNDVHLAVCLRVARKTGWVVKTNPYEGGSDHTVFGGAGVPSVLNWHFTDRYYHTNFDTPDKTSAAEMRNVGVAVAASAWLLAGANPSVALDVAQLVADAGRARIALENVEGAKLAAADANPTAARTREETILQAWRKWYAEAVRSVSRLAVGVPPEGFADRIEQLASSFEPRGGATMLPLAIQLVALAPPFAAASTLPQAVAQVVGPLRVCGEDDRLSTAIPLRWTTLVLAADGRFFRPCPPALREGETRIAPDLPHPADHREMRERFLVDSALGAKEPELRRLAIQSYGRLGLGVGSVERGSVGSSACMAEILVFGDSRWFAGPLLTTMARDADRRVREQAAYAVGLALSPAGQDGRVTQAARKELQACAARERDAGVAAAMLESLGAIRYADDAERNEAERYLTDVPAGDPLRGLGAAKGMEALFRQNARRPVGQAARERLRALALAGPKSGADAGDVAARTRRLALMALQTASDTDTPTLAAAARDTDWQVRRLVALRLDLANEEHARIAGLLEKDTAFQVRYELLGPVSRRVRQTNLCAPIVDRFADPEPTVVLRAIDLLPAGCSDAQAGMTKLVQWARLLSSPEGADGLTKWHVPARALTALARLDPPAAANDLAAAVKHQMWQVRAAAATAAGALGNENVVAQLAADAEPNVRTAAIDVLRRLESRALVPAAIDTLNTQNDFQLLRAVAIALRNAPEDSRADVCEALLTALRRLTDQAWDTSRDPRVAMIERLGELLPASRTMDIAAYSSDFDERVRATADKIVVARTGALPQSNPKFRYPLQPSEAALGTLPRVARIRLEEGGEVVLGLLVEHAPVTIARFAELARAGYYNGLTFHRIVPNFVVQGGSPGASEYVGAARFMRDELGMSPHVRGAVGISTRGRDTGDAQIFIDLIDLPRLDRDYTVFAHVTSGMEFVDRMLEGARIRTISVE